MYFLMCYSGVRKYKRPALYYYDRITFSSFHILQLCELASQAVTKQPTGIFVTGRLLTGRLQVRILFEEPSKGPPTKQVALHCICMEYQLSEEIRVGRR
jgi:hypothetical protein